MMKKILATAIGATLLAGQSIAAAAAPVAADRTASPVGDSEGAISNIMLALMFAVIATGLVLVIEDGEDDAPVSP